MNGNVVLDMVGDFDKNGVVFPGIERWPWETTVDRYNWFGGA